jgi:aspartyl/asparaginyl beta-hydroxylase (cupin superfamily)
MATQYGQRLLEQMDATLMGNGLPPGPRSARFQQSLEIRAGTKQIYFQEPTGYFFPGLPQVQYYEREALAWTRLVEAHTDAIRAELQAVMAAGMEDFRPYMHSGLHGQQNVNAALIDSYDWSTLFLVENGFRFDDLIARCPRTWEAVHAAPLCSIPGNGPTVMFSLLKAGARIAPHSGMFNTRLTCHLPLIVPPGCGFRVGNEVREWREGELLVFDDSVEHEAWNEGLQDRVVLIFDIWRPELSEQERKEVAALLTVA